MSYTTIRVVRSTHTKLKIEAAKQQRTLSEVAEEMANEWLARQKESAHEEDHPNRRI